MKQFFRSEKIRRITGPFIGTIAKIAAVLLAGAILGCAHPRPRDYPEDDVRVPDRWSGPCAK